MLFCLFAEKLDIADMTAEHRAALLTCCRFDWSRISPGVFGSLFQGVMNKKERRAKGAHYTSEENIRRVLDPLCLDDLRAEFQKLRVAGAKKKALEQFHQKLAALRFLDPACGCGNFFVVAYRELRALELDMLKAIYGDQLALDLDIAEPFHFGVLSSATHLAWVKQVCGRIKSDFRYSNKIVYNNYPWFEPTSAQRAAVETAAQAVLDARAPRLAAGASLADL